LVGQLPCERKCPDPPANLFPSHILRTFPDETTCPVPPFSTLDSIKRSRPVWRSAVGHEFRGSSIEKTIVTQPPVKVLSPLSAKVSGPDFDRSAGVADAAGDLFLPLCEKRIPTPPGSFFLRPTRILLPGKKTDRSNPRLASAPTRQQTRPVPMFGQTPDWPHSARRSTVLSHKGCAYPRRTSRYFHSATNARLAKISFLPGDFLQATGGGGAPPCGSPS
jgi:hypothetical protein